MSKINIYRRVGDYEVVPYATYEEHKRAQNEAEYDNPRARCARGSVPHLREYYRMYESLPPPYGYREKRYVRCRRCCKLRAPTEYEYYEVFKR